VNFLGAVVCVPALLLTGVRTFTTFPAASGVVVPASGADSAAASMPRSWRIAES
jgi:hypothetical protein